MESPQDRNESHPILASPASESIHRGFQTWWEGWKMGRDLTILVIGLYAGIVAAEVGILEVYNYFRPCSKEFCREYGWLNQRPRIFQEQYLSVDFDRKGYWNTGRLKDFTINAELVELQRCKTCK